MPTEITTKTKSKPTARKLVTQPAGPVDKRRRKRGLTPAVRTAIDAMMFDRCDRAEACKCAEFSERALYLALAKPEVAQYWNSCLHVLRTGERASNIHRLAALRDQDDNRAAAVKAVQVLEQLDNVATAHPSSMYQTAPGLVIVNNGATAPHKVIAPMPRGDSAEATGAFEGAGLHIGSHRRAYDGQREPIEIDQEC